MGLLSLESPKKKKLKRRIDIHHQSPHQSHHQNAHFHHIKGGVVSLKPKPEPELEPVYNKKGRVADEHRDHALLSNSAYTNITPDGFTKLEQSTRRSKIYEKNGTNDTYIAFRGTSPTNPSDILADGYILTGREDESLRFQEAQAIYDEVKGLNPERNIILTGHSLGGRQAQYVADRNAGTSAVTFAAGVNPIYRGTGLTYDGSKISYTPSPKSKSVNYIVATDPISVGNIVPVKNQETRFVERKEGNNPHTIDNYLD